MRIQIVSDLHLDWGDSEPNNSPKADIYVIAGDLCDGQLDVVKDYLKKIEAEHILMVLGNHDYYFNYIDDVKKMIDFYESIPNVHVLNNSIYKLPGVTFIGSTLFTDFSWGYHPDPALKHHVLDLARYQIGDFSKIPGFTPERSIGLFNESLEFINNSLDNRDLNDVNIVLTHWGPSKRSAHPKFKGDSLNSYFNNDVSDDIIGKADIWIHGHNHNSVDYCIQRTRVIANPKGRQNENYKFKNDFCITV